VGDLRADWPHSWMEPIMQKVSMLLISVALASSYSQDVLGGGLEVREPLIPPVSKWEMNDYCQPKKVGERDFYVGTHYALPSNGHHRRRRRLGESRPAWRHPALLRRGHSPPWRVCTDPRLAFAPGRVRPAGRRSATAARRTASGGCDRGCRRASSGGCASETAVDGRVFHTDRLLATGSPA